MQEATRVLKAEVYSQISWNRHPQVWVWEEHRKPFRLGRAMLDEIGWEREKR